MARHGVSYPFTADMAGTVVYGFGTPGSICRRGDDANALPVMCRASAGRPQLARSTAGTGRPSTDPPTTRATEGLGGGVPTLAALLL